MIVILVSLPMILLSIIIYNYSSQRLINSSETNLEQIASVDSNNLKDIIQNQYRETELTAERKDIINILKERAEDYNSNISNLPSAKSAKNDLTEKIDKFKNLQYCYIIDLHGNIISATDNRWDNVNVSDRQYFKNAISGKENVSDVLKAKIDGKLMVAFAVPVYDNSNIIGVCADIMSMDYFQNVISSVKIGTTGYAYIIDSEGDIISHPDKSKIGTRIGSNFIKKLVQNSDSNKAIDKNIMIDNSGNVSNFIGVRKIEGTNWIFVVSQNVDEINDIAKNELYIIVFITIIITFNAIMIGIHMASSITNPIDEIIFTMEKAAKGDMYIRCTYESKNEIGQLAHNFNSMINKLNNSYEELSEVYEELSATEEELREQYNQLVKSTGKVEQLAYYDMLTGIPNRSNFVIKLEETLKDIKESSCSGAILFVDLDDFKKVNDSLGHEAGDLLLKAISERFNEIIDNNDFISRFGGDEFVILRKQINGKDEIEELAKVLLNIFNSFFCLDNKQVFISASIGISVFPKDGIVGSSILKNADTAMYRAKERGKNNYQFYDEEMSYDIIKYMTFERVLRNGLRDNEFYIDYQPQVELKTGKIVGVEALLRLKSGEMGFVSPVDFIPVAEKTGLILPIGDWIIRETFKQKIHWNNKGYDFLRIAINISAVQINQTDFLIKMKNFIEEYKIKPNEIEIEITESILMKSLDTNVSILKELRNMGIKTSLDDFGTGFSSLNYLRVIPIDTLKIDKSFIDDICINENQQAIVDSIIVMAHKMGIKVVAEGIETKEQLNILKEKDCDMIQGYIFSKPVASRTIEKLLNRQ